MKNWKKVIKNIDRISKNKYNQWSQKITNNNKKQMGYTKRNMSMTKV